MIKTVFYFRKLIPDNHSIEELFGNLISHLPKDIKPNRCIVKRESKGILNRVFNIMEVIPFQQEVNHITGDIHYIAFLLRKNKTILTIHDLEIIKRSNPIKRAILLFFWFYIPIRRVRYVTVISEFTKQELLKWIKVPIHKIVVIPDCIAGNINFTPRTFNTNCPVLLQVGTKPNKNVPNLLMALKDIPCILIILGKVDPEELRLLKKYRINYENYYDLPYEKVIEIYQQIDILTFVSTYEGFGLPILEAQATGRVVVTSNVASMPEVAGEGALLVDPYSVDAIREGILQVINNVKLRENLISKGLVNVKKYSPLTIAEEYSKLYRKICEN